MLVFLVSITIVSGSCVSAQSGSGNSFMQLNCDLFRSSIRTPPTYQAPPQPPSLLDLEWLAQALHCCA